MPPRTVSRSVHLYSAPPEKNHPSLYWNGNVTGKPLIVAIPLGAVQTDVPMRLQFDHSAVAMTVQRGSRRWRMPSDTVSGALTVVLIGPAVVSGSGTLVFSVESTF